MHSKRLFRPFWALDYSAIPDFDDGDVLADVGALLPERGRGRLLLDTYSEETIRERFEHYGVAQQLTALGFADWEVRIDASEQDQQEMTVWPARGGERDAEPLCEMILRDVYLTPDAELYPDPRPFHFLVIQWLRLQNPEAVGAPEVLLPGQRHPGLGLGRKVLDMFVALAHRRGFEGIVNRPEFLHNAWLYSPHFHYLDPVAEGRLAALKRDLGQHSLWTIAWAAQRGCIVEDDRSTFFRWYQGEQLLPNCTELKEHFASPAYHEVVAEATEAATYRLIPLPEPTQYSS